MVDERFLPPTLRITDDVAQARAILTRRRGFEEPHLSLEARQRVRQAFGEDLSATEVVAHILADVRRRGDEAIRFHTKQIDGIELTALELPRSAWVAALSSLSPELRRAMEVAAERIADFHRKQLRTSWIDYSADGALGQIVRPLERVGIYTPGGLAVYPSSLLMTAVPARVAGVAEIVVCAPPTANGGVSPLILAAAAIANVDRVFQIGGAQAIAALAYGTETVPHVDKIFGPGGIFVVLAKQHVFGAVAIDQLPGPTETLIVADDAANAALVAADLLAQAEHDPMASAILITPSRGLADAVAVEIREQVTTLARRSIIARSLSANGLIAIVPDIATAMELANAYAPEHLCLLLCDPWGAIPLVRHAGGIFVGEDSPEALGDYVTGPSHVMPTGGTARFSSPLHLQDFSKVISVVAANRDALERLGPVATTLAYAEDLTAHARAIERRLTPDQRPT